jgi:hypothetical protein
MGRHQENIVLKQGALDQLPGARAGALQQRGKDADGGEHAAHDVVHRGAGTERPARWAGQVGEPTHHLHDLVQRGAVYVWAGQKALQRAVDKRGVILLQGRVAEAHGVERAGAKVLGYHVGAVDQASGKGNALGRIQVERQAALAAIERREEADT